MTIETVPSWRRLATNPWVWRVGFGLSFLMAVTRTSTLVTGGEAAWWYGLQFLPLFVAGLSALLAPRRARIGWIGILMLVLLALCIASIVWSNYRVATATQSAILAAVGAFLAATFFARWTSRAVLVGDLEFVFWLLVSTLVASGIAWAINPALTVFNGRYWGIFSGAAFTGMISAIVVPLAVWLIGRRTGVLARTLVVAAGLLALVTLVTSGSRSPLVAAIVGTVVAFAVSPLRRVGAIIGGAFIVAGGVALAVAPGYFFGEDGLWNRFSQGSDLTSGRLEIWAHMVDTWSTSPVLGVGYRTIQLIPQSEGFSAHSTFLSVLVELGVVGLIVFLALLVAIVAAGFGSRRPLDRVLFGTIVTVLGAQVVDAFLFGMAGPAAPVSWLLLLAFAALGRLGAEEDGRVAPGIRTPLDRRSTDPAVAQGTS